MTKRLLLGALVAVAAVAAACSGGDRPTLADRSTASTTTSSAPSSPAPEACSLVAEADAEATAGVALLPQRGGTPGVPEAQACTYFVDGQPREGFILTVTTDAATAYERVRQSFGGEASDIDGLGDRAAWSDRARTLAAQRGQSLVLVQFLGDGLSPNRDKAVAIATAALARL